MKRRFQSFSDTACLHGMHLRMLDPSLIFVSAISVEGGRQDNEQMAQQTNVGVSSVSELGIAWKKNISIAPGSFLMYSALTRACSLNLQEMLAGYGLLKARAADLFFFARRHVEDVGEREWCHREKVMQIKLRKEFCVPTSCWILYGDFSGKGVIFIEMKD